MGSDSDSETTILLVDDEPDVVEAYAAILNSEHAVRTATGGAEALEQIDDAVDVVFLDRRMPDMSGDELLGELRKRGYEIPIAMLTAVDPGVDIIEMPFDDYLTKPIDRTALKSKVDVLTNRAEFGETSREFYRLVSKKATLEAQSEDVKTSDEYQALVDRIETLRSDLDETLDDLLSEDPEAAFRDI